MNVLRDIAVILLAAEAFLFALVPLALFALLVYGVWRLRMHNNLPTWLRKTREYFLLGVSYVDKAMGAATRPVVVAHKTAARLEGSARAARGLRERQESKTGVEARTRLP